MGQIACYCRVSTEDQSLDLPEKDLPDSSRVVLSSPHSFGIHHETQVSLCFLEETGDDGWRDVSAHDFRRTWATLLAGNDGVEALIVCQWGRWEDLETFLEHYHGSHSPEVQHRARDAVDWL